MKTPEKAEARREPGNHARPTTDLRKQNSPVRAPVKTTEREIAMQVRRGLEKSHTLIYIVLKLQRWRPGNDKLIEDTAVAVYDFEERFGVTAFERAKRVEPDLTEEDWAS